MAKLAIIMDEMFEDAEFQLPFERLKEAGHDPVIVGLESQKNLTGKKGREVKTDVGIEEVSPDDFAGVVIPGGYSPDKIRSNEKMVWLVRRMHEQGKPVAAICHAGWLLAEADIIRGRTVTSYHSIKTDLINAGAEWVDQEVVEDGNLITSRRPDDLESFSKAILVQLEQTA